MLIDRLRNRLVYLLERFLLKGAFHQLLFIAGLLVLVSVVAGTIVHFFVPEAFEEYGEAVWWGFLRLSDPGYLGDDKGAVARTVSLIVTVLGYVLFMGALVAIMTTALGRMMRRLETSLTPITLRGHVLILGWSNRTPTIVRELLLSEGRVQRFLSRVRASKFRIVILAPEVSSAMALDLKSYLGPLWDERKITFRSGNPLRMDHLARADFLNAAAIILPAGDFAGVGQEALDARTIKTLLSVSNAGQVRGRGGLPSLTCEIFDSRKVPVAEAGYDGEIEIIASSSVISRLVAQNVRHGGLSYVYSELLTHGEGNQIYIRDVPDLVGRPFASLAAAFSRAIPMGVMRGTGEALSALLNPAPDLTVEAGDKLVFLAQSYEDTAPDGRPEAGPEPEPAGAVAGDTGGGSKRILVLGWSHKLPALLSEFASYANESFAIDMVSRVAPEERSRFIERFAGRLDRIELRQIEADYTASNDLAAIRPSEYDNVIFLASDWLASGEEADARTILGYLLLRRLLRQAPRVPAVLIELMDPDNHDLFDTRAGEVLISPQILSHMLAHVTLRPELREIFEELFTSEGAEIFFHAPADYAGLGREFAFAELQRAVAAKREIALGILFAESEERAGAARLVLNPPRDSRWTLSGADEVVVLTTYA